MDPICLNWSLDGKSDRRLASLSLQPQAKDQFHRPGVTFRSPTRRIDLEIPRTILRARSIAPSSAASADPDEAPRRDINSLVMVSTFRHAGPDPASRDRVDFGFRKNDGAQTSVVRSINPIGFPGKRDGAVNMMWSLLGLKEKR